jgi:hypothetical protein
MAAISTDIAFGMGMLTHRDMSLHKIFEVQNLSIEVADFLLEQINAVGFAHSQIDLFPVRDTSFWIIQFTKKEPASSEKAWIKEVFDKLSALMPSKKANLKECLSKTKSDHKDDK